MPSSGSAAISLRSLRASPESIACLTSGRERKAASADSATLAAERRPWQQPRAPEAGPLDRQRSYPHLFLLESDGALLLSQTPDDFMKDDKYVPDLILAFLEKWEPKRGGAS
jgi:hypothetical protein